MKSPNNWVVIFALLFAAGCRQDMHDTPRYEAYEASTTFADGRASRAAPAGTVVCACRASSYLAASPAAWAVS